MRETRLAAGLALGLVVISGMSAGGWAKARADQDDPPRRQPSGSLAWFKQGVELARQGEYIAALNRFKRAKQLSPNWALPYLEIAVAHLRTDNDRKLIGEALTKAVKLGPEIPRARYLFGVFLHEGGKRTKAIHEFVQALKRRPSMLDARYRLATLFVEEGRQPEGIKQYELVLGQRPSHLGARRNLAILYEQSGRVEEAEKQLKAIARFDPQNVWHQTALGRFYDRTGASEKAKQAYRRVQQLEPTLEQRRMRPLLKSRD
jgi:tetratricopeptide (TPR) repeat protein